MKYLSHNLKGRRLRRALKTSGIRAQAFTLIETMLAVLVLGLLACAATLSFSQPLAQAQAREARNSLCTFDQAARDAARSAGKPVRVEIDPARGLLSRFEGASQRELRASAKLPREFHIDQVLVGSKHAGSTVASIDFSLSGWCRSYAVHLRGPKTDYWLVFAGLSGQMSEVNDEAAAQAMLGVERAAPQNLSIGNDAD